MPPVNARDPRINSYRASAAPLGDVDARELVRRSSALLASSVALAVTASFAALRANLPIFKLRQAI